MRKLKGNFAGSHRPFVRDDGVFPAIALRVCEPPLMSSLLAVIPSHADSVLHCGFFSVSASSPLSLPGFTFSKIEKTFFARP